MTENLRTYHLQGGNFSCSVKSSLLLPVSNARRQVRSLGTPTSCFTPLFGVMSPKIENKFFYQASEYYLYGTLFDLRKYIVDYMYHCLLISCSYILSFYFQSLLLMYFTYDVILLFTVEFLCLYICLVCVVTWGICFILFAQFYLLFINS